MKYLIRAILLSMIAGSASANSTMQTIEVVQQALHRLTWDAPNQRTNGDPLAPEEIVGYKVERLDDNGAILETIELDGNTTELAISIVPNECMVYKAYAVATDGSPASSEGSTEGTLTSEPADAIRICVIPPKKPRNFRVQ